MEGVFLLGGSLPFRSGVVVSLRPLSVCQGSWLVTVLTSTHLLLASSTDSPGALCVLPSFTMVVRTLAVGPGFSYASCLTFTLLWALGILVHLASLLH